jgi:hypothetical protein
MLFQDISEITSDNEEVSSYLGAIILYILK